MKKIYFICLFLLASVEGICLEVGANDLPGKGDSDVAIMALRSSAERGDTQAQLRLAEILITRPKNALDLVEAVRLFRKTAVTGDQESMLALAYAYEKGVGVQRDQAESIKWLRSLAASHNKIGLLKLAEYYTKGEGVPQSGFISRALEEIAGYVAPNIYIINKSTDLYEKFGPLGRSKISDLVNRLNKPGKFIEELAAADKEAIQFNGKYGDLPFSVRNVVLDAEAGDNKIINQLGVRYKNGDGDVKKDPLKAVYWFKKAESNGDSMGKYCLAKMFLNGIGVERNYVAAARRISELAERDFPESYVILGVMYKNGIGVRQDFKKALYWLKKSAANDWEYKYPLAQMYYAGHGVGRNLAVAYMLAKSYVELHPGINASEEIGEKYLPNDFIRELKLKMSPSDLALSDKLARCQREGEIDVFDISNSIENKYRSCYKIKTVEVAEYFFRDSQDKDYKLALNMLRPLVESKDPEAQNLMYEVYSEGLGVSVDLGQAGKFLDLAAEQGNVTALTRKALRLEQGPNMLSAFSLYKHAAESGGAFAQVKVADMLYDGRGVKKDLAAAKFWYERSLSIPNNRWKSNALFGMAKIELEEHSLLEAVSHLKIAVALGHKFAQLKLAKMYLDGEGVPKNLYLSYALAEVAKRDDSVRERAADVSEEARLQLEAEGKHLPEPLVLKLWNLDRYSYISKKDSEEFLKIINASGQL